MLVVCCLIHVYVAFLFFLCCGGGCVRCVCELFVFCLLVDVCFVVRLFLFATVCVCAVVCVCCCG